MPATESSGTVRQRPILLTVLGAAVVCIVASLIPQQFYTASRGGFGSGDVTAFLFWGVQFAFGVGLLSLAFVAVFRRTPGWLRHLLALVMGAGLGLAWSIVVRSLLGHWFRAFSFPVLYFWMFGGSCGLLFASLYAIRRRT